jgi:hypothetical protein
MHSRKLLIKRAAMRLSKKYKFLEEFNPLISASFTGVGLTPTLAHKYIVAVFIKEKKENPTNAQA